jgi:hypothetical protein
MDYPDDKVTEVSKHLLEKGATILQGNRLEPTDAGHLTRLAHYMDLNGQSEVADMGCGFGAVSWFLSQWCIPKAHFWLINQNAFQLKYCPIGPAFTRRREDMCSTSIPDNLVDLVMFNYSLCHVEPHAALTEAARIARDHTGRLFVYDYVRVSGDDSLTEKLLAAKFQSDEAFRVTCEATGWKNVETFLVGGDDAIFREAVNDQAIYESIFEHLQPVIWRAQKGGQTRT